MEYGRSNRAPVLEEDDDDRDVHLPSHIIRDQINLSDLHEATGDDCINDWARKHMGDTHLGKWKFQKGPTKADPKCQKGKGKAATKPVSSDTETDDGEGETQFTHATQDTDHGAPQSQRRTIGPTDYDTPQYSSSSYSDTSQSFHYLIPDISEMGKSTDGFCIISFYVDDLNIIRTTRDIEEASAYLKMDFEMKI
ncbi:uncharacterized protein LOC120684729 [Panicum virgatum]|uniref:uncharacterized protein LOC120684729 n=1 Tax=Panicum virgatum TaxID=38727 RepID=UPI0019D5055B|nr:uncharacterized protein LOC120684729 [Panicum virgatum]